MLNPTYRHLRPLHSIRTFGWLWFVWMHLSIPCIRRATSHSKRSVPLIVSSLAPGLRVASPSVFLAHEREEAAGTTTFPPSRNVCASIAQVCVQILKGRIRDNCRRSEHRDDPQSETPRSEFVAPHGLAPKPRGVTLWRHKLGATLETSCLGPGVSVPVPVGSGAGAGGCWRPSTATMTWAIHPACDDCDELTRRVMTLTRSRGEM